MFRSVVAPFIRLSARVKGGAVVVVGVIEVRWGGVAGSGVSVVGRVVGGVGGAGRGSVGFHSGRGRRWSGNAVARLKGYGRPR